MSAETQTANISRKRMKLGRPERSSHNTYTRRTAAQLAHLEELVEEKKPGNLYGSFSVFELAPPKPRPEIIVTRENHHALLQQEGTVWQRNYPPKSFEKLGINHESRDGHSKNKFQSVATVPPFSDFRTTSINGLLGHVNGVTNPVLNDDPEQHAFEHYVWPSAPPTSKISRPLPSHPHPQSQSRSVSHPEDFVAQNGSRAPSSVSVTKTDTGLNDCKTVAGDQIKVEEAWQFSSRSMLEGPKGAELAHLEDCLSEDIPIRAIVSGWDSIGEAWELPPFWQIIRRLDENLFFLFDPIERLGVFRIMHLLMRYHSDPSPQRASTLPSFFNSRSIDFEGDYYIGNFLPWPGIREFTKSPLHPCRSTKWFKAELKTLKLLWPYRLQDCFTRCHETGLFKLTDEFGKRTHDINCWTFGPDMYEEFPMMYGVAPARGTIPSSPGPGGGRGLKSPIRRCIEYKEIKYEEGTEEDARRKREYGFQEGITRMMEENSLDYNNLHWRQEERSGKKVMYFTLW